MNRKKVSDWFSFFAPRFYMLAAIIGVLTRIILLLSPITEVNFSASEWLRIFGIGLLNDLCFATIALVPAFVVYTFMTDGKYKKPWGYVFFGALFLLTAYVLIFNDITDEYGGVVPGIARGVLVFFLLCFAIKLFVPKVRRGWRTAIIWIVMLLYAVCVIMNVISEYTFWAEFGVRYNFIAVDYLVYTNEVIGNIMESYPILPLFAGVLLVSCLVTWLLTRGHDFSEAGLSSWKRWALSALALSVGVFAGIKFLHWGYRSLATQKVFVTELQDNGCWNFIEAFNSNELSYAKFYETLPQEEAEAFQRELCGQDPAGVRKVTCQDEPALKNIVLVMVESLSAEFLSRYGEEEDITPCLDALLDSSLVFDRMFATGNRTVRGLEALTLCIPPSAGESLVKRPVMPEFFSTGGVLRGLGYSTTYFYGGDSYFDNMGAFFSANGYAVTDKKTYPPQDIIFSNIWGTCDEDTYRVAIDAFDEDAASGKPFFAHLMTISNHRPYTYPDGRIDYEGKAMSRKAAVKYSDYALGKFIKDCESRPWFKETVFVIVADHCASSAGKVSLPLDCYRIPAIIYAPGFVKPRYVDKVCSQIDIMPTLFSLLGISYDSRFYGQDVLADDFRERAFMATYQDLGYYADDILTVMSPVRSIRQFSVSCDEDGHYTETLMDGREERTLREAQAYYQTINLAYGTSAGEVRGK